MFKCERGISHASRGVSKLHSLCSALATLLLLTSGRRRRPTICCFWPLQGEINNPRTDILFSSTVHGNHRTGDLCSNLCLCGSRGRRSALSFMSRSRGADAATPCVKLRVMWRNPSFPKGRDLRASEGWWETSGSFLCRSKFSYAKNSFEFDSFYYNLTIMIMMIYSKI